jgi:hypothetical protein
MNFSTDGGLTWQQQCCRVTDAGVTSPTYWEKGFPPPLDLRSRIGLAARGDTFYGVSSDLCEWTTPSAFYHDVWDQRDVFLGRVRLPLPDFDYDRDFDQGDCCIFLQCFGGSGQPPASSCPPGVDADLDGDGDVDLADYSTLTHFYAPGVDWCPSSGLAGGDAVGGESGQNGAAHPTTDELYDQLEAYCIERHIPFT